MVRLGSKLAIMMAFGGAVLLAAPTPVKAVPIPGMQIKFTDVDAGGFTVTIADGGPGDDDGVVNGEIKTGVSAILLPNFTISSSDSTSNYSLSNPTGGGPPSTTLAYLTQGETQITNTDPTTAHTLKISLSANAYLSPNPVTTVEDSASMTVSSGSPSSVIPATGQSFDSATGELFALDSPNTLLTLTPPAPGTPGNSSSDNNPPAPISGGPEFAPYSITNVLTLHFSPGAITASTGLTTNKTASVVIPGPGGLALVLAGLPFLGVPWLRRRGKQA